MKRITGIIVLLLTLPIYNNAQQVIKEACIGSSNSEWIVTTHDNSDSTITIIYQEGIEDTSSGIYNYYYRMKAIKTDRFGNILMDQFIKNYGYSFFRLYGPYYITYDNIYFHEDGSFLIVVDTYNDSTSHYFITALKYNKDAILEWESNDIVDNYGGGFKIASKPDSGYIVCYYNDYNENITTSSISKNGEIEWHYQFSTYEIFGGGYFGQNIQITIIPKFNKKTFLSVNLTGFGFWAELEINSLYNLILDSTGNLVVDDTIVNSPVSNSYIYNYLNLFSNPYIFESTNYPINFYTDSIFHQALLNTDDLSFIKDNTFPFPYISFWAGQNNISDTSHLFYIHSNIDNSTTITCTDINLHTLWTYLIDSSQFDYPVVIDNNTLFFSNTLIHNGQKVWEHPIFNRDINDSIYYHNKTYYSPMQNLLTKSVLDNNNLCIVTKYTTSYENGDSTIYRFQAFDINNGSTLQDFIIDSKIGDISYFKPIGNKKALLLSSTSEICGLGESDVYLAIYGEDSTATEIYHQSKKQNGSLLIYPNPSNGTFTINFKSQASSKITIELMDLSGKIIFKEEKQHLNESQIEINTGNLSKELYLLRISSDKSLWSQPVIIQ